MAKRKPTRTTRLKTTAKILAVFGAVGLVMAAFVMAERRISTLNANRRGPLVFEDPPGWVDQTLLAKAYAAAGGSSFYLQEEGVAARIGSRLESLAWLKDVTVQVTLDSIRVKAQWRKPLAQIKSGFTQFYVDEDLVVLDLVPLELPIVTIRGVRFQHMPDTGMVLKEPALASAMELVVLLDRMDQRVTPNKPLLGEIDEVDMENYQGRQDPKQPHIILLTTDGTRIIWGAEIGEWDKHLETNDEAKLAKLYTYYRDCGTLLGGVKYINLRDPRYEVPLPTAMQ